MISQKRDITKYTCFDQTDHLQEDGCVDIEVITAWRWMT
jgi:hypothetical protein